MYFPYFVVYSISLTDKWLVNAEFFVFIFVLLKSILTFTQFTDYYVTTITHSCIYLFIYSFIYLFIYLIRYLQSIKECSWCTSSATTNFILQVKFFWKLNFPSFLNFNLKEQYFNRFWKFVRNTCLHFHFDSLSQSFHRTDIHLSESVLQMCNKRSYVLKTIIGCSLQKLKVAVADTQLWALKG